MLAWTTCSKNNKRKIQAELKLNLGRLCLRTASSPDQEINPEPTNGTIFVTLSLDCILNF